ncbi:hypothetical protein Mag101_06430 [Microbulbifer agarilyticus]|uniref:DUF1499 domain-containing protein n=1 Tax=Microbulbifer agarilyticus TaxID=260552 RepID=A0A1Q2M3L1_9GAMM|nr:DUF1499 domain-containing protein [Microbulbifer agarilyticus]AQQ67313.1 hypothetical protein Mag101_06430 [Microbulbifer agarilyticus]
MLRSGRPRHWSRWLYRIQWILLALIGLAIVAVRVGVLKLDSTYSAFTALGLAMIAVALIAMLVFLWGMVKRNAEARTSALWAMLLAVVPVAVPMMLVGQQNLNMPALYDITTDLKDPPEFDMLISLRREGDNSPDYPGRVAADIQAATPAYADIKPLIVDVPTRTVIEHAEKVARELGWRVIAVQPAKGRLELVGRTPLLGLTQDIVVRVRPHEPEKADESAATEKPSAEQTKQAGATPASAKQGPVRVDVRSASRTGARDLGSNAGSIRLFLGHLQQRLERWAGEQPPVAQ